MKKGLTTETQRHREEKTERRRRIKDEHPCSSTSVWFSCPYVFSVVFFSVPLCLCG